MGILDDAIREHLDLKRRQGADQEELARLEDEAFGPPTRPGDPEFADRTTNGEHAADAARDSAADAAGDASPTEATGTEVPAFHDQELAEAPEAGTAEAAADTSESAVAPKPSVGADEPAAAGGAGEPATADDLTLPGEETVQHDTLAGADSAEDIDLDIDLELDEEVEDVNELDLDDEEGDEGAQASGGEAALAPPSATDEPIESLDTVEHHFEDAIDEAEVIEDEPESAAEDSEEDEDVLEETPEFLRDAPEDDELWFEQGEPKDFDF